MERLVEKRARELTDADRIEAEIERRAEERAHELYRTRSFEVLPGTDDPETTYSHPRGGTSGTPGGTGAVSLHAPVEMKPGWQLGRGFSDDG